MQHGGGGETCENVTQKHCAWCLTHDAWHAICRPIGTQQSCDHGRGNKPESETAAIGQQGKLFLWSGINKWWAFMREIKNSCQMDSVHRYQHLSLSLRLSPSTLQDTWESEREEVSQSEWDTLNMKASLFWRIKDKFRLQTPRMFCKPPQKKLWSKLLESWFVFCFFFVLEL